MNRSAVVEGMGQPAFSEQVLVYEARAVVLGTWSLLSCL